MKKRQLRKIARYSYMLFYSLLLKINIGLLIHLNFYCSKMPLAFGLYSVDNRPEFEEKTLSV